MRILKMKSEFLKDFLMSLEKFGKLYGPKKQNNVLTYAPIESFEELVLNGENTLIPLKKLFHPKKFDMFHFDDKGFKPDFSIIEKRVIVGAHPCEIHGILRLDEVFLAEPQDPYYKGLRDNTAIIGFSCMPTEYALCKSTGTDIVEEGFDLFFDDKVTHDDIQKYIDWREDRDRLFKSSFNFPAMPDIIELSYGSEVWDYFADKCLSCGQCTMVCPTCNCYNVIDVFDITSKTSGRRERVWDSCMYADYSLVAGGHNFRGGRADRLKLWYTHKLKAFAHEYGKPSCVGCGRCVETCPVDINVLTVSEALTKCEVPKQ